MKWLILLLLLPLGVNAQIITAFAGGGTTLGDGGPATASLISDPAQMAFDKLGNLYVTEFNGNRVRKINISGIITTIAGTGTGGYIGDGGSATAAKLNKPAGVVLDTVGNIFIADASNNAIRRIDAVTGIITTICGNGVHGYTGDGGPASAAQLYTPNAVSFDHAGNLFIADYNNNVIRKINTAGNITTFAGTGVYGYNGNGIPATSAKLYLPTDMQADDSDNIYIADGGNNRIRKVNTAGIITTYAGNGTYAYTGDDVLATAAQFTPNYMMFDSAQNLYTSDEQNDRVYVIYHTTDIFHTVAGDGNTYNFGNGGPATAASFSGFTDGIALDVCGNLYINNVWSSGDSDLIRKVILNTSGIPSVTISANPGDTVCKELVTYTATVSYGSAISYQWYVDGIIAGATSNIYAYIPSNGDSVRCALIATSQCSGDTDTVSSNTINMVVNPPTVPTVTLTGSTIVAVGSIATVNATVTGAGSSYTINWYDNGVLFTATSIPTVTYAKGVGTDNITATVIPSSLLCYDSSTSAVFTITDTNLYVKNTVVPQVYVYPNPAHGTISILGHNLTHVTISNLLGQVLINKDCSTNQVNINIASLSEGVYVVKVMDSEGRQTNTKIVKE